MSRAIAALVCLLSISAVSALDEKKPSYPSFEHRVAYAHEIKPHRHTIPLKGVQSGFHQYRLMLTVSPAGDVLDADPSADPELTKYWPQLQAEVRQWKFTPFEQDGKAVTATVEEYIELVPPERLPAVHVAAPVLRAKSKVKIMLSRSVCYGTCPAYTVTVSTNGVTFEGDKYVSALGKQTDPVDPDLVRKLAKKFVDADFYSMDSTYRASVTDNPTYVLAITIDGHKKQVTDYVGQWVGMPAVVTDLEDDVNDLARTERWIHRK